MSLSLDQILPSLQALGIFGYWLIGLASMLEAFFLTGGWQVVLPVVAAALIWLLTQPSGSHPLRAQESSP